MPAITMDSGLLDVRTHFGLNVQPEDTVKVRRQITCNVLPLNGHVFTRNASYFAGRGFEAPQTALEFGTYRNTDLSLHPDSTFVQHKALTDYQQSYGSE
jgi:hypothetical protein